MENHLALERVKYQCTVGALWFHPNVPYFLILLQCLTPDDFTRQEESAGAQWVNNFIVLPAYACHTMDKDLLILLSSSFC
jgi:hypothetical protein